MGEICESRAKIAFLEISHFILSVYEASTVWQKCLFLNVTFQICQSSRAEHGWMMWSKDHKFQQRAERILLISVGKKFALEHAVAVLHSFTMFYGTVPAPPSALSNKALKGSWLCGSIPSRPRRWTTCSFSSLLAPPFLHQSPLCLLPLARGWRASTFVDRMLKTQWFH